MDAELKQMVECAAEASGRSMNAEICARLMQTFSRDLQPATTEDDRARYVNERLQDIEIRLLRLERPLDKQGGPE